MEVLKQKVSEFNKVIDLLLLAGERKFFKQECERIKRNQGWLNHYGFVANTLLERYNILYYIIKDEVVKYSKAELVLNNLWEDVSYFKEGITISKELKEKREIRKKSKPYRNFYSFN